MENQTNLHTALKVSERNELPVKSIFVTCVFFFNARLRDLRLSAVILAYLQTSDWRETTKKKQNRDGRVGSEKILEAEIWPRWGKILRKSNGFGMGR
jgi:hypothetical protein